MTFFNFGNHKIRTKYVSDYSSSESLDTLMEEHGILINSIDDEINNFDITDVMVQFHESVTEAFIGLNESKFSLLSEGYTIHNSMSVFLEEEDGFFTRLKNRIIEVWNRVVTFFSNIVNKVRSGMFGKLGPTIKEIKSAIDSGKMDYSKAVGKKWNPVEKINYVAEGFVKICADLRTRIKSLANGEKLEARFRAAGRPKDYDQRSISVFGHNNEEQIGKEMIIQYYNDLIRKHLKDVVNVDKSHGSMSGKEGWRISHSIGIELGSDITLSEDKAKELFRKSVNDILNNVDKAISLLQKSLTTLRNDVEKIVNSLDSKFKKGEAYKHDYEKEEREKTYENSKKAIIISTKLDIMGIAEYGRHILSLVEKITNSIIDAVRNNIIVMKSCITKEKTNEKIEESFNYYDMINSGF